MNKLIALMLAITTASVYAKIITTEEYSQQFKNYDGCFILYSVNKHKVVSKYNPTNRCRQRIAPDSTFKIALSLMAFNEGIINQDTIFKWDGKKGVLPTHDQDQTPLTWLKYSVVWVSQQITPQLGLARIKRYLADFNYGNQNFKGDAGKKNGLQYAWLSSSLKISALEQLNFLNAMLSDKLHVSKKFIINTKRNMYQGKLDNGADYYGKTGSGRHGPNEREPNPSQLRDGWFVGFIEMDSQQYIFVSNLTDKLSSINKPDEKLKLYGSEILKPITMKLLNDYFAQ
ncbi:class-D beta-lactamase [Legionella santicrucis]|uniref:Beta-lactamase n=1 Tax=Legionella santicrucis TaxID=45074 RepID=A0A0W0YUB4_9GAMM|nr:penicillin-binding transpeptidase domain-containing protein [Legionella santicrucis]KTD60456.1 class-D beta-lactamase [Legionella santicrucis]